MFKESRNSIRTPSLTRCGTYNDNDDVDDDVFVDDDVVAVHDGDADIENVHLWKQVNDGVLGG